VQALAKHRRGRMNRSLEIAEGSREHDDRLERVEGSS
jgi:hypothetical protein